MEFESLLNNINVIVSRFFVLVKLFGGVCFCDDFEFIVWSVSFVELFFYIRNKWVSFKFNFF